MKVGISSLLLFPTLLLLRVAEPAPDAGQAALALTHVALIDATGAPLKPDATVVIRGDRIAAVGRSGDVPIPQDARVVDETGKFLIPGLWDMHVHFGAKENLGLLLANGVTGVRVMWGSPDHYEWRSEIEGGQLPGPRMVIASTIVDGPVPYWPGSISVSDEEQAHRVVEEIRTQGADFVKVYQNLPREAYFAVAAESKKGAIPFAGHVPLSVSAEEASNAGQRSFEHLVGVLPACSTRSQELLKMQQDDLADAMATKQAKFWGPRVKQSRQMMLDTFSPERVAALSALFKKNGTWQCPTLTLLHMMAYGDDAAFLADPRLKYVPVREKANWNPAKIDGARTADDFAVAKREFEKDLKVVGLMQRAGVGILAGTDAANPYCFHGFSLHDELGFLVKAGLTPMEALQTATVNPSRFLRRESEFGTVESGKVADLVVLEANPLIDIANTQRIASVVSRGKLLTRSTLDAMLAQTEVWAARKPIGDVLFATIGEKGADAAVKQYRELRLNQPSAYDFGESELVGLGYVLIHQKRYSDAITIFKLSVESFPQSYNTCDSLAEAYMDIGNKYLAISNYRKSLEINPRNLNAVKMLKQLGSDEAP